MTALSNEVLSPGLHCQGDSKFPAPRPSPSRADRAGLFLPCKVGACTGVKALPAERELSEQMQLIPDRPALETIKLMWSADISLRATGRGRLSNWQCSNISDA